MPRPPPVAFDLVVKHTPFFFLYARPAAVRKAFDRAHVSTNPTRFATAGASVAVGSQASRVTVLMAVQPLRCNHRPSRYPGGAHPIKPWGERVDTL